MYANKKRDCRKLLSTSVFKDAIRSNLVVSSLRKSFKPLIYKGLGDFCYYKKVSANWCKHIS